MNAARRLKTWLALMAMAVLALGALTMAGGGMAAQEGQTSGPYYWFDSISKCEDRCPGLKWKNCRCYKMPPLIVIIEVPKK